MAQMSTQPAFTDESGLVASAKRGDGAAFTQLVNRYERKIFRLAKHITQNEEDAEDVLQDTFLKAYEHVGEFQEQSKFYTWLVRIAVNEALMKLRKRKSGKIFSLDDAVDTGEEMVAREIAVWDDNPEQRYSQEELRGILQQAIDGLALRYSGPCSYCVMSTNCRRRKLPALWAFPYRPSRAACCAPGCSFAIS